MLAMGAEGKNVKFKWRKYFTNIIRIDDIDKSANVLLNRRKFIKANTLISVSVWKSGFKTLS